MIIRWSYHHHQGLTFRGGEKCIVERRSFLSGALDFPPLCVGLSSTMHFSPPPCVGISTCVAGRILVV